MSYRDKVAGLEIETAQGDTDLHVYPRESRRGKAQWTMWVKKDGSAVLFVGVEQIILPKNESKQLKFEMHRNLGSNEIEFKEVQQEFHRKQ